MQGQDGNAFPAPGLRRVWGGLFRERGRICPFGAPAGHMTDQASGFCISLRARARAPRGGSTASEWRPVGRLRTSSSISPPGPQGGDPLGRVQPGDTGVCSRGAGQTPAPSSCSGSRCHPFQNKSTCLTKQGSGQFRNVCDLKAVTSRSALWRWHRAPRPRAYAPRAIEDMAWPPASCFPSSPPGSCPVFSSLAHLGPVNLLGGPAGPARPRPALPYGTAEAAREREWQPLCVRQTSRPGCGSAGLSGVPGSPRAAP